MVSQVTADPPGKRLKGSVGAVGIVPVPSTVKTAEKADDEFRVYSEDTSPPRVVEHYRAMRTNQTVEFYHRT